jgi:hypothetical protein
MVVGCAALMAGGCAGGKRAELAAALKGDEPPADFSLAVTVHGDVGGAAGAGGGAPAATGQPGSVSARYVMEADWVLRAATGAGVSETTFPAQTRQLTHDQVQRLWWELRDSGLLEGGGARAGERGERGAVISYSVAGVRRTIRPLAADRPPVSRIVDRLAELAWVKE